MSIADKLIRAKEDYDAVYEAGHNLGYEAGKKAEYDRFWDNFQNNGQPQSGDHIFAGKMWTDNTYNPKYPIVLTNCTNMYRDSLITDTKVDTDVSRCVNSSYCFNNAEKMVCIRKIITSENISYIGWFAYCRAITEIRFEGVIGKSLDIHWSKNLSMISLNNIVTHLSKTATGQTLTLPATAKETYDNSNISGAWDNLVAEYPNWTFAYA